MYKFNAEHAACACIKWIQKFFEENGKGCNAVLGISGGKDSSVVAALLVKALGKDRVIGVLMPNGEQADISYSYEICEFLGIKHYVVNIKDAFDGAVKALEQTQTLSNQAIVNLAPRIRMSILYAVSQCNNGRVANTCNLSEDYVGYSTKFGDSAGDFSPISNFTKTEVRELGEELGLPKNLIYKVPEDGMSFKSDEEKLGFTYEVLDKYIRTGEIDDLKIKEKIDKMHLANLHKIQLMPSYKKDGK